MSRESSPGFEKTDGHQSMLLTMTLTDSETSRWSVDGRLRADLKLLAAKTSTAKNRRFWQVQGANGSVLAVGEASTRTRQTLRARPIQNYPAL
jgi:hypothetical protein